MADSERICSVDGCNKPRKYIKTGWCSAHYARWKANGSLELPVKTKPTECSVKGCNSELRPGSARGMCIKHYLRWKKHGDPLVSNYQRGVETCTFDGCKNPYHAKGFCDMHYQRVRNHGRPDVERSTPRQDWMEAHKDYAGDNCLPWPFSVSHHGRGQATLDGQNMSAPRAMCILAHGEPPTPQHQAAHSCGKGHEGCMNPKHLSWKTPAENEQDKREHGTLRRGRAINTNKLDESQVLAVRAADEGLTALAQRYDVTKATISQIKRRKSWAWLT